MNRTLENFPEPLERTKHGTTLLLGVPVKTGDVVEWCPDVGPPVEGQLSVRNGHWSLTRRQYGATLTSPVLSWHRFRWPVSRREAAQLGGGA